MTERSSATRIALIETGERLFAERGIEAVSLRDVCAEAAQRNHSAAQYHFGDRAGLLAAVYEHRMSVVNVRRHAMLDALPDGGAEGDLTAVLAAFIVPLTDVVAETSGWYGRFLARTRWDLFAQEVLVDLPTMTSYHRGKAMLDQLMDRLRADVRASRIDQIESLIIGTVAGWEAQRYRGQPALPLLVLQADLVATASAVATAPSAAD